MATLGVLGMLHAEAASWACRRHKICMQKCTILLVRCYQKCTILHCNNVLICILLHSRNTSFYQRFENAEGCRSMQNACILHLKKYAFFIDLSTHLHEDGASSQVFATRRLISHMAFTVAARYHLASASGGDAGWGICSRT